MWRTALAVGVCAIFTGCADKADHGHADVGLAPESTQPELVDSRFESEVVRIAGEYTAYETEESQWLRWAPQLCSAPPPRPGPALSEADSGEHARKLYRLYAKDVNAYPLWGGGELGVQPVGQVLVKESFASVAVEAAEDERQALAVDDATGQHYATGQRTGLFMMFKLERTTQGTDDGWVYATTTPDGRVTAAGRIESCMRCHTLSTADRMLSR